MLNYVALLQNNLDILLVVLVKSHRYTVQILNLVMILLIFESIFTLKYVIRSREFNDSMIHTLSLKPCHNLIDTIMPKLIQSRDFYISL